MSIKKNSIYNLIGALVPILVSLLTIPIYLKLIGDSRFGILTIVWLLIGYFGLFDLGLGRATAQQMSSGSIDKTSQLLSKIFWTALMLNGALGALGGIIIWPFAYYFFSRYLEVDSLLRAELFQGLPWLMLAVPLATISGVLSGALQGRNKFLELNGLSIFGSILMQLIPLYVAWAFNPSLAILIEAVVLTRIFTLATFFFCCISSLKLSYKPVFSRQFAGKLLNYGGWVTITSCIGPLMVVLDRFIIGIIYGSKAVTYYTVPFQLAERMLIIPGALGSSHFSIFSAEGGSLKSKALAQKAIKFLISTLTPLSLCGIFLANPFMSIWISPEFAIKSELIAKVLIIGFWINSIAIIPYFELQAYGRPDLVAKCHLAELFPYLGGLYIALNYWGIVGAAIAFSVRASIDCFLLLSLAKSLLSTIKLMKVELLLLTAGFIVSCELGPFDPRGFAIGGVLILISILWTLFWKYPLTQFRKRNYE